VHQVLQHFAVKQISASPSHLSPHTDPNLHMLCLVCNNALGAGGNGLAYYSCSVSSAGHGHSIVCVPCFSSLKARLTECLVRMAARGQEELTGNHVVASALKFGDGLPAVRSGGSEPMASWYMILKTDVVLLFAKIATTRAITVLRWAQTM